MEVNNGIIIDGVLHEAVQDNIHCASCSLYEKCAEVNYTVCITNLFSCGGFINRGKVTDIKIDKEEWTMTEELVTLEIAKLLKDKGFNWKCEHIIGCNKVITKYDLPQSMSCCTEIDNESVEFLCPTLYIAQKWLRETKKLHVEVSYMYGDYWIYDILTIPNHDLVGLSDRPLVHYKSYEEALEAGIQETLKLI